MKKNIYAAISFCCILGICFAFTACGKDEREQAIQKSEASISIESALQEEIGENMESENEFEQVYVPSKEEVLAMRAIVLEGMSEEEIDRLTENIKVANIQMESAYLNDNIFDKLADKDSPYWLYFDKAGDIQLGWWYNGWIADMDMIMRTEELTEEEFYKQYDEPGIVYNRFDAANFIKLLEDMKVSVHHEMLISDIQQLIDLTYLAEETHEAEYANRIYKILHDLDYFLLRYGIEDVGKYTSDTSTVSKYYGVLNVYQNDDKVNRNVVPLGDTGINRSYEFATVMK